MTQKTNAARLLDQLGIHYELREYEVDPNDLSAETVAAKIGMPLEQVFKTLVARGDRNGVCLAAMPSLYAGMGLRPVAQVKQAPRMLRCAKPRWAWDSRHAKCCGRWNCRWLPT